MVYWALISHSHWWWLFTSYMESSPVPKIMLDNCTLAISSVLIRSSERLHKQKIKIFTPLDTFGEMPLSRTPDSEVQLSQQICTKYRALQCRARGLETKKKCRWIFWGSRSTGQPWRHMVRKDGQFWYKINDKFTFKISQWSTDALKLHLLLLRGMSILQVQSSVLQVLRQH